MAAGKRERERERWGPRWRWWRFLSGLRKPVLSWRSLRGCCFLGVIELNVVVSLCVLLFAAAPSARLSFRLRRCGTLYFYLFVYFLLPICEATLWLGEGRDCKLLTQYASLRPGSLRRCHSLMNFYDWSGQKLSVTTTTTTTRTTSKINYNKHGKSEIYMIAAQRWNIQGNSSSYKNNNNNYRNNNNGQQKQVGQHGKLYKLFAQCRNLCKHLNKLYPKLYWQMCVLRKISSISYYFNASEKSRIILNTLRIYHNCRVFQEILSF